MSWKVKTSGKPSSVTVELASQFRSIADIPADERELKDRASDLIFAAVRSQPDEGYVDISAWGTSRIVYKKDGKPGTVVHAVSISIVGTDH